jgi:hypothetical protein
MLTIEATTKSNTIDNGTQRIDDFLMDWDKEYQEKLNQIDMFNPTYNTTWTKAQAQYFAKVFYHSRGHFNELLWQLGNFAPNKAIKSIILHNIAEEFNGNDLSHEQLYLDFAESLGLDLSTERIEERYYLDSIRTFNLSHLLELKQYDWQGGFALFSAYERLDKIDYEALMHLPLTDHKFFRLHRDAKHFDKTYNVLIDIWKRNMQVIKVAFAFVARTQITMWKDLSDAIFNYKATA